MSRPIVPDFARAELRDNPESEYAKRISKQIESWRVLRDGQRAIDDLMMPIVHWLDKQLKRLTK